MSHEEPDDEEAPLLSVSSSFGLNSSHHRQSRFPGLSEGIDQSTDFELESRTSASSRLNPHVFDRRRFIRRKGRATEEDEHEDYVYLKENEAPRVVFLSEDKGDILLHSGDTPIVIRTDRRNSRSWFLFLPTILWLSCWCFLCTIVIICLISTYWLLISAVSPDVQSVKHVRYDSRGLSFDLGVDVTNPNVEAIHVNSINLFLTVVSNLDGSSFSLGRARNEVDVSVAAHETLQISIPIQYSFQRRTRVHDLISILTAQDFFFKCDGHVRYSQLGILRDDHVRADNVPTDRPPGY